jgi:hypothetical protein
MKKFSFSRLANPFLSFFIFLILLFCSCKKFIEIRPAPNLLESSLVFSTNSTALSAASGVYTQLRGLSLLATNGGLSVYTGLSADELFNTSAGTVPDQFFQNALLPNNNSANDNFWIYSYRIIYQSNAIISGLANAVAVTDSVKKQLTGEMKFVRAFCYFLLVNLYGDVPLITSVDYATNAVASRSAVTLVYQQIINDLLDAQGLLKTAYISAGKARPNKWSATALLARVYLFQKNWNNAVAQASSIINAGTYSLLPSANIANTFLANSAETIWEIASDNANTIEGAAFIPSSASVKPVYALTPFLLTAFEAGDLRKTNWLRSNTINTPAPSVTYYYPFKYKERSVTTPVKEYVIVFRLAELYLIRAEARLMTNDINGAKADLNSIRTRAGLAVATANDIPSLLLLIEHERQVELFAEWGHRWFDLKRTNRIDAVLGIAKGTNWQPTDALYPVPQAQLDANVYLVQNPGY